ncbi:MAG: EpsG family protein [Bacilli bacterium]|nr:EpsG family protein [Bacilli bacterium]
MDNLLSIIFLWVIFGVSIILSKNERHSSWGFILLFIISAVRWDIGNDFMNYYYMSKELACEEELFSTSIQYITIEITYKLIVYIFRWMNVPNTGVMILYSGLTILLIYKSLKRINGLFWGCFAFIFSGILFMSWDQIRQWLAIAIFLYSINYIEKGKCLKYIVSCIIAMLFHYSAIILFPLYLVKYLKLNKLTTISIFIILFIGFVTGLWTKCFSWVFSLSDTYSLYMNNKMQVQEFSSGLGVIARLIIYCSICLGVKDKCPIISNIMFVGICIYLFSCSNEMIERISNYGTSVIILAFPFFMKKHKNRLYRIYRYGIVLLLFILCTFNAFRGTTGCIPYDTIFSENYEMRFFREREYRQ